MKIIDFTNENNNECYTWSVIPVGVDTVDIELLSLEDVFADLL